MNGVLDVDIVPPFKIVLVVLRIIKFIGVILDTVRMVSASWVVVGSLGVFWVPIRVVIVFVAVFSELFAHLNWVLLACTLCDIKWDYHLLKSLSFNIIISEVQELK